MTPSFRWSTRRAARGGASPGALSRLAAVDLAAYRAVADAPPSRADPVWAALARAGTGARLWLVIASGLVVSGRPRLRRAAAIGVGALAATSVLVDLIAKPTLGRHRPARISRPATARVRMPRSASLPSGHGASSFAFATAVGAELPVLAIPLCTVAAGVAYSRVRTGVHYPSDVVVGCVLGAVTGWLTHRQAHRVGHHDRVRRWAF